MIASQFEPSLSSASPVRTTTRCSSSPFARSAYATPTAIGRPWPREPVDASIPGTCARSGCAPRIESYPMNRVSSLAGKKPFRASTA